MLPKSVLRGITAGWVLMLAACGGEEERDFTETVARMLSIAEEHSLHRYSIDWAQTRTEVQDALQSVGPRAAILTLLETLGDGHSFYEPAGGGQVIRAPSPACALIPSLGFQPFEDDAIGYISVVGFSGSREEADAYATSIQGRIRRQDSERMRGWVVDLSENRGGNMWPMIAGLAPILGDRLVGHFIDPDGNTQAWTLRDGGSYLEGEASSLAQADEPYRLMNEAVRIAVLTSRITASSGEAAAIAFRGDERARSFGTATCGLSTANAGFPLPNGATFILTTAIMADRDLEAFGERVPADAPTSSPADLHVAVRAWLDGA